MLQQITEQMKVGLLQENSPLNERFSDRQNSLIETKTSSEPWFNLSLFSMGGWYLTSQEIGFISSGNISQNRGIFPLYTTAFILATDLEITGTLSGADSHFVSKSIATHGTINLGPFNITTIENKNTTVLKNDNFFVIGWISELLGLSPKITS